jgi:hypothetical protein
MRSEYTNSRGEQITLAQLIFGYVVYGISAVVMMTLTYLAIVFFFCY